MNILVVNDNKDVKTLSKRRFGKAIKQGDTRLPFAYSGERIPALPKHCGPVEVMVPSDINIPGLNRFQLHERIKMQQSGSRTVAMTVTAFGDPDRHKEAKRIGADVLLTKPLNFALLKDKIKTLSS